MEKSMKIKQRITGDMYHFTKILIFILELY